MHIAGIGTALPAHSIAQEQAAEIATTLNCATPTTAARIRKLYRLARVARRHSVLLNDSEGDRTSQDFLTPATTAACRGPRLGDRMSRYEHHAPRLATAAARRALDKANTDAAEITHLVTVSCSGFAAPGMDIELIRALGLPAETQRTHVGFMGCHGALNGLRVARGFAESDPVAVVLLVAVEICSVHYQYSAEDEVNLANGLFSDGAAALVARAGDSEDGDAWRVAATGSCVVPDSVAAMTWKVRDHGFQMTLAREVPALIEANLDRWLSAWLEKHGLSREGIATWAVHPGGPAILNAVRSALRLKPEDLEVSWQVLREYGNMSSPTILFVLERLREARAPAPCVALGFGPGLAIEAVLFA